MFTRFKTAARQRTTARELYGAVVALARTPIFYAAYGVPDTPEGRFELIVLHLSVVIERLNGGGAGGRTLARLLGETFVTDMDDNMREMGVGDLAVPKKLKRAAAGLYERAQRYRAALAAGAGDRELHGLAGEFLLGPQAAAPAVDRMAVYIRHLADRVAVNPLDELLAGKLTVETVSE